MIVVVAIVVIASVWIGFFVLDSGGGAQSAEDMPPAAITDLAPYFPDNSSVELRWTAPGDDNNSGTAAQYDIRYASSAIDTEVKFAAAEQCIGEPTPSPPGTVQTFNVTNLMGDAIHYFVIKTADEVPNWSPLSNSIGLAPDFTLNDTVGTPWHLFAQIRNGKPILLQFMHPECIACQTAAQLLIPIYNNYSQDVEIVSAAVSFEVGCFNNPPTVAMIAAFMTQYGAVWRHVIESPGTQVRDAYGIVAVPTFFLIGKDGGIAYVHQGYGSMNDLVDAMEQALLP